MLILTVSTILKDRLIQTLKLRRVLDDGLNCIMVPAVEDLGLTFLTDNQRYHVLSFFQPNQLITDENIRSIIDIMSEQLYLKSSQLIDVNGFAEGAGIDNLVVKILKH